MGLHKKHSQFSDTKYKWRTVIVLAVTVSLSGCGGQELLVQGATDPYLLNKTSGLTELSGGVLAGGQTVWTAESSPYLLRDDLLIERDAQLSIEPGVEIRFAPMIGITVRGKLIAVGEERQQITFTSTEEPLRSPKPIPDIRLVDGPSILAGRVQVLLHGQWRSVCTNSRNWTTHDMETACRQLGFMGGSFYNWIDRQPGRHARLLFEEPKCKGTEYDLFQCDWSSRQLGSGVCDYHPDLAIQCLPHHDNNELVGSGHHWRGIRFENAVYERILTAVNTLYVPTSMSKLVHVTIKNAGLGRDNNATSALDVIGVPPMMEHLEIANSAFNAINVTMPNAPIIINNCTIQNNRGYGIYVNSSYGMTKIENCLIHDNGGDGIKYVVHELNIDERFDRSEVFDLCTLASTPSQTFPIQMTIEQSRYSNMERDCNQKFYTRQDHVLTLRFMKITTNTNFSGEIYVYDGLTPHDKLLLTFSIRNNTRPQSVTSTRNRMYVRFHANTRTDIIGFLRLTSGVSKTYDLNVTDTIISDNNGRGVAIENLRSQVHIHRTSISNNNHVAGLQVLNGAGDVNVTESRISFNQGDGINITMTGGNRNISKSIISSNQRHGIAVWINNTQETEYIPVNQTTTVEYSELFKNWEIGILHGNYCGDSWVNITGNWFNTSHDSTIDISTCWLFNTPSKILSLQIGHNRFYNNMKVPIKIQPALNVLGKIEYNYFEMGEYGAIAILNRIEGKYLEDFEILPSRFYIQQNHFYGNKGPFVVNLGLSPYSDLQYILFTRNFLRDNKIREQFEPLEGLSSRLTPRSRVAAAIVLASSNIDVFRNIINNPEAQYEIGSHVEDQSKILNCTYNWLGSGDEEKVYNRLFHRKDRYNLAKIIYMPYLLHSSNPGATQINYNSLYVPQFNVPGTFVVGGEVDGTEILRQGEYQVDKDINIRPGGKLVLQSGVTLKFPPAIGMMVAGRLDARGKRPNDITFTLKEEIIMSNDSVYETDTENYEPTTSGYLEPIVPIRLLGGRSHHEGRLQVRINEKWGTVCNYRWTITNAALVCHQLGLALNPEDWFLEPNEIPSAGLTEDIILSNVECTEFDNDVTKCKAESVGSFENSCTHENDVGIRCFETSWAGVRFSPISERADLQYVSIEKAGLLDYSSNLFKPALQIDFSRHSLESVKISNNYHDGLGIIYSDLYGSDAINTVRNSEFSNNRGSGISLKQLGLKVYGTNIENNNVAGISHNPHITGQQQREISGWFNIDSGLNTEDSNYHPIMLPEFETDISLANGETRHILFTKHYGENLEKMYNIKCNPGFVLGLQLLNPIHNFSTENICIYDSQNINEASTKWCLDRDLTVFPTTSSSFGVVLTYQSGNVALGGAVMVVSSIVAPVQNLRNRIVKGPVPTLQVVNSKIKGNTKGIRALFYNRYLNEIGDHFLRKANESIKIFNCEIAHNKEEAVYINTPFWDIHDSNITEITLMFNSSLITDNGKGIYHFARDLRSSNNLYHYILQDNTIERNKYGGFDVMLPYVWQYNENFTHSVYMYNNTWRNNQKFGVIIDGHFAEVNITKNIFTNNYCKTGLMSIRGMEKKMKIDGNFIERNNGQYMVQFYMDSQSEIMGLVYAVFVYNNVKNNKYMAVSSRGALIMDTDPTYVIGFKGIQKVKVSRNLFGNNDLLYTLLAGIKTAKINNLLDVTENWWGSANEHDIKRQIFDFDDWNNHAIATYLPYLLEDSIESSLSVTFSQETKMDVNELGGRVVEDLTLDSRIAPYVVKADLTVMPDVTLTINPGVILEFAPNVGILVMGSLFAVGRNSLPILMRPKLVYGNESSKLVKRDINKYSSNHNKYRRQLESLEMAESIRLCTGRNCSINDNILNKRNEGFLEYYNRTTLQWVPMCDNRFTERNAQVVCRELGFDPINAFFSHDRRVEYHSNSLSRIWSWPEPLQCVGTEDRYENCPIRLNGQLYGHRHACKWDSEFVFIHCGNRNLDENMKYWGGIRFTNPEFEYSLYEHRIHDHHTHETMKKVESVLEHVHIYGAGILHNEKSPAIQSIVKNPRIQNVNISTCAHHGINLVSPTDSLNMMFNTISDVLGEGINAISLTGEGRESEESSFSPLKELNLPYHLFSLIDICDSSKVITVEERVLLYYKYDNNPVNCVKIFKSMFRVKPFGFRLLQYNLFNHTKNYGKRDSLSLYDGDIYNITAPMIGYLEHGSPDEKKLFRTQGSSLSVKLFANGASAVHGFIAEVVTLPISAIAFNRDVQHNISSSDFFKNRDGAISYNSVGEVNPLVAITRNEFTGNCLKLYGNFTTCQSAVRLDVQNTQTLVFRNNLVRFNVGGLAIRADSRGSATSLRGWIHSNLFYENHDLPCLKVEGRQSSPYQEVTIYRNYFTRNKALYNDVIVLRQVVSNFTYNYVHDNTGMRILEVSGFHKVRLPIYQTTSHNGFYRNHALDREGRATIVAGTAGQHYVDNIFFNPDNDYEMITVNRSIFVDYNPNVVSSLDVWRTRIDAKHNYWSYNESLAVAGRIRDRADSPLLLEVEARPFHRDNRSVLGGGKCPPAWDHVADSCLVYVGAPMTYEEARLFCLSDNASMPYVSNNYGAIYNFIQRQNQWYRYGDRVWVNHIDYVTQCTSFASTSVDITDCNEKNPFICEIDPRISIDPLWWRGDVLSRALAAALLLAVLLLGAALVCWCYKSKHRHLQRLERRNSIRQSLHSVRSIGSINGSFPDTAYRRKMAQMSSRSTDTLTKGSDYKKILASTTSLDTMEKSQFNSSIDDTQSFDIYEAHNPNPNMMPLTHSTFLQRPAPEYSVPARRADYDDRDHYDDRADYADRADLAYRNPAYRDGVPFLPRAPAPYEDHYGGADTLPLRSTPDTLPLRSPPDVRRPPAALPHSTFGHRRNVADQQEYYESQLANEHSYSPSDDQSADQSADPSASYSSSPRESSRELDDMSLGRGLPISKSKSEALLETNFDFDDTESETLPITEASRSHSQPLETAM